MTDRHDARLNKLFDDLQARMPGWAARALAWLRAPRNRWLRIPAGLLLMAGGVVGFLPVLGFWMLPLGVLLLALDIPALRRPVAAAVVAGQRRWRLWRRR